MSVIDLFKHGLGRYPQDHFLTDAVGTRTYAEADAAISEFAAALQAAGLVRGSRVALLSRNSSAAMIAVLAIYRAGCVFVPLNAAFLIEEHLGTVQDLAASALLFGATFAGDIATIADRLGACRPICIDGEPPVGISRRALVTEAQGRRPDDPLADKDDVCAIYPTGGSTGKPKRVMHTHLVWETMAASFLTALPVDPRPTYLMMSPLTHAAGAFALMLMARGAHVIIHDGFSAEAALAAIARDHVTHLFLPPTAIYKLLAHPASLATDCSSLKAFIYSAAPMSVEKLRECVALFGPVMVQFWGQMEAPSFLTCLSAQDHVDALAGAPERLASCGRETLFTRVAVMADDGRLLPDGERGELVVRSNLVMKGYYENPEATAAVSAHGWHHTGDLGYRDDNGFITIVGRKSDIIITGGFNVYPVDVEQVLWSHPAVEECAVIGIPDALWGEAVHAIVQLKPGQAVEPAALIALCKERLGSVRAPKRVELREDLPRNAVGKIDKPAMRQPFWKDRARAI